MTDFEEENEYAEDLSERVLEGLIARLESERGNPRIVLRPTQMVLRPDLTDEQMELAHAFARGELG